MVRQDPDLATQLLPYFEAIRHAPPDRPEAFEPVLDSLGDNPERLAQAGDLFAKTKHLGCAQLCFERALELRPGDSDIGFQLAGILLNLRQFEAAMSLVLKIAGQHGIASYGVIDQLCNEALWLGKHQTVSVFIGAIEAIFKHAASAESSGYFVDAMLAYACESNPDLFIRLCEHYRRCSGQEFPYLEQCCLPAEPPTVEFLYSSHCYAGTSALINLLLMMGIRVDEIGRRWDRELALDATTSLRSYVTPPEDELPARFLQKFFPFQRQLRCYSFSHRQINPALAAGRPVIFLLRDPRASITTWVKPRRSDVELGSFGRFAITRAHDWCRYVDGLEQFQNRTVIRFEDWKRDPAAIARSIAERVGLTVRDSQLLEAVHYSGTDLSRQIRSINSRMRGLTPTRPQKPDDPPATTAMLQREYGLIAEICGPRLERYGYPPTYGTAD